MTNLFSPAMPSFSALSTGMPKNPAVPNLLSSLAPKNPPVMPVNNTVPKLLSSLTPPAQPKPNFQPINGPATYVPPPTMPVKPIIPSTTPAAYAKPNPSTAYVKTPSGATVDAHTGALISPPPTIPNVSSITPTPTLADQNGGNIFGSGGSTTPTIPDASTVTGSSTTGVGYTPGDPDSLDPSTNPLFSSPEYNSALASVGQYSQMSPEEKAIQDQITNLNSSENTSYINAEGHGQDLPFVTGEQKNITELGSVEGSRLAGLLSNAQAQRQLNLQGATTRLTAAEGQLQGLQARNAPVTVPFGGTVVSKSGATIGGGVFGNAGSGTSGTGMMPAEGSPYDPTNVVDQYVQQYMQTGDIPAKFAMNPAAMGPIIQRANDISMQQTGQPFNAASVKANITSASSAISDLNGRLANSQSALPTIIANGQLILQGMQKANINQSDVPIINQMNTALKNKTGISTGDIAAFNNSLTTLRNEYARLLMGKGQTTDKATGDADSAIPDNISPSQLSVVLDRIVSEGKNVITGLQGEITSQKKSLSPYDFSGSTPSTTNLGTSGTGNSSVPAGWSW